jgi:hypothetical protein
MPRLFWCSGLFAGVMGFLGTLLALLVALPAVADAQGGRLQAERLTIMGDNGAERIRLQTVPGLGANTQVLTPEGERRVSLTTAQTGGGDRPDVGGVVVWRDNDTAAGFFGLGRGPDGNRPLAKVLVLYDDAGQSRWYSRSPRTGRRIS